MTDTTYPIIELRTANGRYVRLAGRVGTNDHAIAAGLLTADEYRLREPLSGWAIDVGAHIGTIAVALALDNPDLRVIAVEPLPENVEMIRFNAALNDVTDRITVIEAAATSADSGLISVRYDYSGVPEHLVDPGYLAESRYIGNMLGDRAGTEVMAMPVTLEGLLDSHGIERLALLKIDCEGCEYRFLVSPALWRCERIVGEYHDSGTWAQIEALLSPTHMVTRWTDGPIGLFGAVAW